MDTNTLHDSTVSVFDGDAGGNLEALSNNNDLLEGISSNGEVMRELGSAHEFLTRLELDLACASEKLVNLNILMMHVAAKESDFELYALEKEDAPLHSAEKALEFDFLSGIFDSEVKQLDAFMASLQRDILSAHEIISSYEHLGEALLVMEEKLHDSKESLKQSQYQVSEMRMQSAKFQKLLSGPSAKENLDDDKLHTSESGDFLNVNEKIKMQTSEQQRHILRMLEKSLARELDLEKKLTESRQIEEELKLRLHYSVQEVFSLEEETAALLQRYLEADNTAGVMMGISKELMACLQLSQLSLNSAVQRENELKSKLQDSSEAFTLKGQIVELKEKAAMAESRAATMDAKCKLLEETNKKLNEELAATQKVESLQRQLCEADIQLQQAVAAVDASEEKQSLLYSSINDMEVLIEDLKLKFSKAEYRADSTEEKCVILSESNAELNEELNYLRGRLECLEASIHQAEETKVATAKDINLRTKMITDLVMRLAIERERLHGQISSLMKENRSLGQKLQEASERPYITVSHDDGCKREENLFSECNVATAASEKDVEDRGELFASNELRKEPEVLDDEAESDPGDSISELDTVRTIDMGRVGLKLILTAVLVPVMAIVAACFLIERTAPSDL
ncbi:hypothetical protein Ancab_034904 [Ancistrocladus abbreviatus]